MDLNLIPFKELLLLLLVIFLGSLVNFFLRLLKANERLPYYAYFSSITLNHLLTSLRILLGLQLLSGKSLNFINHYPLIVHIEIILSILTFTFFIYKFIDYFIYCLQSKNDSIDSQQLFPFFKKILVILLFIVTSLAILQYFGYSIKTILTGLGIGGIAVALAAQESLSNFIASFVLIIDKPFQLNDVIRVNGLLGEVVDFGLKSTTLRSSDNILYVIPNKILVSSSIENLFKLRKKTLKQILRVQPAPSEKIEIFLKEVKLLLENDPRTNPERVVLQSFTDHTLDILIQYTIRASESFFLLNGEFNLKFLQLLEKNNIHLTSRS